MQRVGRGPAGGRALPYIIRYLLQQCLAMHWLIKACIALTRYHPSHDCNSIIRRFLLVKVQIWSIGCGQRRGCSTWLAPTSSNPRNEGLLQQ